jgi:hypothetical protein
MRIILLASVLLVALACELPALGQNQENLPRIDSITFETARYIGGRRSGEANLEFFYRAYTAFPDLWAAEVAFNPAADVAEELDIVHVSMVVVDDDLAGATADVKFFVHVAAFPGSAGPPEPPPLIGATFLEDKYAPTPTPPPVPAPPANAVLIDFLLLVPRFEGVNQSRLRGFIDYDVRWTLDVRVANSDSPAEGAWDEIMWSVRAKQNPALVPPNPPAFADAGAEQTVAVGSTATLDASRSFDSSNLGFEPRDTNVFLKDTLTYAWAWVSGPERVDPQPSAAETPAKVEVTLEVVGDYVYQVVVDDGVNPLPSTATTTIHVVQSIRGNLGPRAVISDAAGQAVTGKVVSVSVGNQVKLSAARSTDLDNDPLTYRWRQTNEVGGALASDEVLVDFQPLNGIGTRDVAWVATKAGTYYFSLLVADVPPAGLDPFSATARVTVDVAEAATAGDVAARADVAGTADPTPADSTDTLPATPAGCGGGSVLPLALLPGALWLMRRPR